MKKLPIAALFSIALALGAIINDRLVTRYDWLSFYRKDFARRGDMLSDEAQFAKIYLQTVQNLDSLTALLESRKKLNAIDFWAITNGSEVYRADLNPSELQRLNLEIGDSDRVHLDKSYAYSTRRLESGFAVAVGLRYDEDAFLASEFEKRKGMIAVYLAGVVLVGALAFAHYFRDLALLLDQLGHRRRKYSVTGAITAKSREAERLARGLNAYEGKNAHLEREKNELGAQVQPSLRGELASGRTPPYDFACTLVRTDINNFSLNFKAQGPESYLAVVESYFSELSDAVARHGGLMHEFVGDEAIYCFKDDDLIDSTASALAAIREADAIAERVSVKTLAAANYFFTVKSTLAHGRLRYGRFVRGFNLAGEPLIETVRILSQVREKDGNVAVFDSRHLTSVSAVAKCESYASVELKGILGIRELFSYKGHLPIEDLLNSSADSQRFAALIYYRSEQDVIAIIDQARSDTRKRNELLRILRKFPVPPSGVRARELIMAWLGETLRDLAALENQRLAATLIALTPLLISLNAMNVQLKELLQLAIRSDVTRIAANAFEALAHFRPNEARELALSTLEGSGARLEAVALMAQGTVDFDRACVKRFKKMLASPDPNRVASALYALGEVAAHHRSRDIVYFESCLDFTAFAQKAAMFAALEDASIRLQAARALQKFGIAAGEPGHSSATSGSGRAA